MGKYKIGTLDVVVKIILMPGTTILLLVPVQLSAALIR